MVSEIAGISIRQSNNLPFMAGEVDVVEGENNNYAGDFSNHCGLIYYKDAAAVVSAIGPSIQTTGNEVKTIYQGDVIVGRMAMGAGTLNPLLLSNSLLQFDKEVVKWLLLNSILVSVGTPAIVDGIPGEGTDEYRESYRPQPFRCCRHG